ncbi:MAG TPA: AAA family ATPase, partial [Lacipirellulaceae bacterium]
MSMSTTNEQRLSRDSTSEEVARVVEHVHGKYQQMCAELSGTIVGMKDVTEQLMIGILCRGHCILQ